MYINCHSYFSLRYGTFSIEKLIETAAKEGHQAIALTDINNSSGIIDFVAICKKHGIKPLAGIEFRNDEELKYIGIAVNNQGFHELNRFLSHHLIEKQSFPDTPPHLPNACFIYPFGKEEPDLLVENEFIGVQPHHLNRLRIRYSKELWKKMLVWLPVTYLNKTDYELHRHLRAINQNTLFTKLNSEHIAGDNESFRSMDEIRNIYAEFPELIANTHRLLDQCSIDFDYTTIKNKQCYTESRNTDKALLEKLATDGWKYRYGNDQAALQRVKKELEIIDKLGFSAYFLIVWDIIRYSMNKGIYHVGRGSGANSIVAYCLKITDIDPMELNLYFERFINPKRSSPPDFDIDYSWKDRTDIQDYIFKRYGKDHTALLGTTSTFQGASILRELGKVYGLPKEEIDLLINEPESYMNQHELAYKIVRIGQMMEDFPNLRSIHAGGILISEKPITWYTALDMPPKGFQTTQWDMHVAESIRFEKIDILSQRGIGHIKECVDIIARNKKKHIDIHDVSKFKSDPQVKYQLKTGETIGCFYIESPAMRGLLKKLRCDNYISLVAASSIIRPGVARSGMMREYIHRFHHPDEFKYIHPVMKEQLEETYGVMVYQEDVLKVCHHFAGLDLADSDVLRRAMSGKSRSKEEFQRIVKKFFSNCKAKGYPDSLTNEVWRQIESFAGYSFSKAHSASYAVESFQSLYLKAHYPLEFMVAVLNNFGGFYKTWVYVNEARRCGAQIELPCVNNSDYLCCIKDKSIYLGLILLSGLETKLAHYIIHNRQLHGPYLSLEDFVVRSAAGKEQMILLIRIGALRFTGKSKAQLLWEMHMLTGQKRTQDYQYEFFRKPVKSFKLPVFKEQSLDAAYDEIELLGFPVSMSYFDLLQTRFRGKYHARNLIENLGQTIKLIGLLVAIKYSRTINGKIMHFGCFLDIHGEFFDTVHFPESAQKYPFKGRGVYLILGKVTEEFGHPVIETSKLARLPIVQKAS